MQCEMKLETLTIFKDEKTIPVNHTLMYALEMLGQHASIDESDSGEGLRLEKVFAEFAVDEQDVVHMDRIITNQISRREEMAAMAKINADIEVCPGPMEEGAFAARRAVAYYQMRRLHARNIFGCGKPDGPSAQAYQLFMADNIPWRNVSPSRDLKAWNKLRQLPIRGLCARDAMMIVAVPPDAIKYAWELVQDWGFRPRNIIASITTVSDPQLLKQIKPYSRHPHLFFLAASSGDVPVLNECNQQGRVLDVRTLPSAELPSSFWHSLSNAFSMFSVRLRLFSHDKIPGWDTCLGDFFQSGH